MDNQMDTLQWILGIVATNVVVIVGAVLLWIKNARMFPKEAKSADLKNMELEASIAAKMQDIAKNAALQVIGYQDELAKQHDKIEELQKNLIELNGIKKEFVALKKSLLESQRENKVLRTWSKALAEQVSKYESPVPMPKYSELEDDIKGR